MFVMGNGFLHIYVEAVISNIPMLPPYIYVLVGDDTFNISGRYFTCRLYNLENIVIKL